MIGFFAPHGKRAIGSCIQRTSPRIITLGLSVWVLCGMGVALSGPTSSINDLFDAGEYTKVTSILQQALATNPRDAQANLWMARCYFELGDFDQSIRYAEQAEALEPGSSQAHLWLARAYGRKAERAKSFTLARKVRREFERAVELDPNNLPARRDLMEYYLGAPWILGGGQHKAWQQAEAIAARDVVEGHLARAAFWDEVRQPAKAEAEYRQALESRSARVEPYFEVAEFFQSRNDGAHMEAATQAAGALNPNDPRLAYFRGVAMVLKGHQLPEAERLLNAYLAGTPNRSDYPSHASAYEWLGRLYELQGRAQKAAEQYRSALRLDSERREAREGLRRLHMNP